jgi:hypothetical protein
MDDFQSFDATSEARTWTIEDGSAAAPAARGRREDLRAATSETTTRGRYIGSVQSRNRKQLERRDSPKKAYAATGNESMEQEMGKIPGIGGGTWIQAEYR